MEFQAKSKYTGEDFKMCVKLIPGPHPELLITTPQINITWKELRIFGLDVMGYSNAQIEQRFKISNTKRRKLMKNLGDRNRHLTKDEGYSHRPCAFLFAAEDANLFDLETVLTIRMAGYHLLEKGRQARQAIWDLVRLPSSSL